MFKNLFKIQQPTQKSQQPVDYIYNIGIKVYNEFSSSNVIYDAVTKTFTVEVHNEESYVINTGLTIKCDIIHFEGEEIIYPERYYNILSYRNAVIKAIDNYEYEKIKKGLHTIKYIPVFIGINNEQKNTDFKE